MHMILAGPWIYKYMYYHVADKDTFTYNLYQHLNKLIGYSYCTLLILTTPALAYSKVDDVRPVLSYYQQFDDPLDQFHQNQAKLRVRRSACLAHNCVTLRNITNV